MSYESYVDLEVSIREMTEYEDRGEIWEYQIHTTFMKTGVAVREAVCS